MRVLLINPHYPLSENPSPPLGLACLGAALEAAGITVRLVDYVVYPYTRRHLARVLEDFDPALVGVTAVTMTLDHALCILSDVKQTAPHCKTVIGGPHVSFRAEQTMQHCPAIDFVVFGEGDETLPTLARTIAAGRHPAEVAGIAFRSGGTVKTTGPRPLVKAIDSLPAPARHLIPLGRYRALGLPVSMITSRGCPFNCIFCVGRKMAGPAVRRRDPRRVVDEMAGLAALDFRQINIADDLFTASAPHCRAICREIIQRGLSVHWTAFARVDTVTPPLLAELKAAGCSALSFGVESGNAAMLRRIRKGITTEQACRAVQMTADSGIAPQVSFILGLPGETPESLNDTLHLAERLKNMGAQHGFHLLAPFPGTNVRENRHQYDLQILSHRWRDYHANRAVTRTAAVSRGMLDHIVIQWEAQFNQWLGELKQQRENGGNDDAVWPLTHLEHVVLMHDWMMRSVIEKKGIFHRPASALSDRQGRQQLAHGIAHDSGVDADQIDRTLAYAVERGYLTTEVSKDRIVWKWKNG